MRSRLLFVVLLGLFAIQARADQVPKTGKVTFGAPIQVPGAVLDAGTYTFTLTARAAERHVVQIFNEDGTKLIDTVFVIPNSNLKPTEKPVLIYGEHPSGQPAALQAWFAPGENFGDVFVYPKSTAAELSRLNNTIVPAYGDKNSSPTAATNARTIGVQSGQLPHTASAVPLLGFAAITLLAMAIGLRIASGAKH